MYFRTVQIVISVLITASSFGTSVLATEIDQGWKNLMLGAAELDAARFSKAEKFLTKAIALQPKNPAPLIQRGRCYWRLGKNGEAIADFTAAIKLHPQMCVLAQTWKFKTAADESMKNWQAVITDCDQLLKLNPSEPFCYSRRAVAYEKLGNTAAAKGDRSSCTRIAPRTQAYWQATNVIKTDADNPAKLRAALGVLDKHLRAHPEDAEAYYERAAINSQLGEQKATAQDYDTAVRLCPDRFIIQANRAKFLESSKHYKEAIAGYTNAVLLAPGNDHWMLDRAACYKQLGDFTSSIRDYSALCALHPDDEDPLHYRAKVYVQTKEYALALADYNRVIQLAPDQSANYSERSRVLEKLGQRDLALKDEQKAAEVFKDPVR